MKYNDFKYIADMLKKCDKVMDYACKVVHQELFDEHNALITFLVEKFYTREMLEDLLYPYLMGNLKEYTLVIPEGCVKFPLKNLRDVWQLMETYGVRQ